MKSFMLLAVVCLVLVGVTDGMPFHASCRINWTFSLQCSDVQNKIAAQIGLWNGPDGCSSGGEKCLYKLGFRNATQLKGTHETPKQHYVDDLTFIFTQDTNKCNVTGMSRSETWYAVLDDGTNYCNLHNLIVGSGLDKSGGYSETTSNSICTQFTSADCSKY